MDAMTATADTANSIPRILRWDTSASILTAIDRTSVSIRGGTVIRTGDQQYTFSEETPVRLGELVAGLDYGVGLDRDSKPYAAIAGSIDPIGDGWIAGFHFAPGGNATGIAGGDKTPAINPFSLWDLDFRPACPNPRGMFVQTVGGKLCWADIYELGVDHLTYGTSRCGATIADGRDLPQRPDGNGKVKKLDYPTAVEIYAHHGKRLITAEEFFAAAYGVKERCSRSKEPATTGEMIDGAERFISQRGMVDATGTMWQWGTDGHPDDPRPSLFGGSWVDGDGAGSRCANLDYWPGDSDGYISARGACDHLIPG